MSFKTADLHDANIDHVDIATMEFRRFGQRPRFSGKIATLQVYEDFGLIKQTLSRPGGGQVLVIDGGGSMRCAMLGDKLAMFAIQNLWGGILINGCLRDSADIDGMDIGVKALGTCPVKPALTDQGHEQITVTFAGLDFVPGDYIYSDEDGILISKSPLLQEED